MKTTAKVISSCCDLCRAEAMYDAPTKQGPWAYMCEACYQKHGLHNDTGFILRKEAKPISDEYLEPPSDEEIEAMMFDTIVPAACEHGCECEPDGHCEHGKPSWLIKLGIY